MSNMDRIKQDYENMKVVGKELIIQAKEQTAQNAVDYQLTKKI